MMDRQQLVFEMMEIMETGITDMLGEEAPDLFCLILEAVNDTGTMAFLVGKYWYDVEEKFIEMLDSHFPEKQYVSVHQEAGIIHGVKLFHDENDAYAYNETLVKSFDEGLWNDVESYNENSYGTISVEEVKVDVREINPEDDT